MHQHHKCCPVCAGQGLPHEGNYSSWLEAKAKRMEVGIQLLLPFDGTKRRERKGTPLTLPTKRGSCHTCLASSARSCFALRALALVLVANTEHRCLLHEAEHSSRQPLQKAGLAEGAAQAAGHACQKIL